MTDHSKLPPSILESQNLESMIITGLTRVKKIVSALIDKPATFIVQAHAPDDWWTIYFNRELQHFMEALVERYKPREPQPGGRLQTTGRFDTRKQLEERVLYDYYRTRRNITQIAKAYGISWPVAAKIINNNQ